MTRINFNRYSSGSFGSNGGNGSGATAASAAQQPEQSFSLLHRIANHCARLGRNGLSVTEATQVDGVPVLRTTPLNAWAADLGWREGQLERQAA